MRVLLAEDDLTLAEQVKTLLTAEGRVVDVANDGEEADVASALAQQYWPKFAGDRLPETATACALGLADRLWMAGVGFMVIGAWVLYGGLTMQNP